jgi:hypothetical protein
MFICRKIIQLFSFSCLLFRVRLVTPESIRLRKQILNKNEREKASKKKKKAE